MDRGNLNGDLSSTIISLVDKVLTSASRPTAEQIWTWLQHLNVWRSYSKSEQESIQKYFYNNDSIRRGIQALAFVNPTFGDTPWSAIIHDLPRVSQGLALSTSDILYFMQEVSNKPSLSNFDISLWSDLASIALGKESIDNDVQTAIDAATARHPQLATMWSNLNRRPIPDWEKENDARRKKHQRDQARKIAQSRKQFAAIRSEIQNGVHIGALHDLALAYRGHYSDFNSEDSPKQRLSEWLGDELADCALDGFVAVLSRTDLPTKRRPFNYWNL
jgi:hypothetical protein